jgi:Sulfotransferase domain
MTRPTFLIIGAMKGGTTSLHSYLGEHPQVQMAAIKETNFFAGPPPDGEPYPPGAERIEQLRDYEALFDPSIEVRGEASPTYTTYPRRKGVPERIKDLVANAKIVYIVRDPVDRVASHYHHRLSVDGETRPLREALGDFSDPYCPLTCPGLYAAQLERYLPHFPQDDILVVDQADLLGQRRATLREIFAFLAVDESFDSPRFDDEMNTGKELRTHSSAVVALRRTRTKVAPLWWKLPEGLRRSVRSSVQRVAGKPLQAPTMDDDLRAGLREFYAEDAGRLRGLTGKAFPTWSV